MSELLTVTQIASRLKVTRRSVHRYIKADPEFPGPTGIVRVGRGTPVPGRPWAAVKDWAINCDRWDELVDMPDPRGGPRQLTTHCRSGRHEWIEENIDTRSNGTRHCRPCDRERSRNWYHAHKARP